MRYKAAAIAAASVAVVAIVGAGVAADSHMPGLFNSFFALSLVAIMSLICACESS
jgi:hypothetical protein